MFELTRNNGGSYDFNLYREDYVPPSYFLSAGAISLGLAGLGLKQAYNSGLSHPLSALKWTCFSALSAGLAVSSAVVAISGLFELSPLKIHCVDRSDGGVDYNVNGYGNIVDNMRCDSDSFQARMLRLFG